jgi:hypothetical protein
MPPTAEDDMVVVLDNSTKNDRPAAGTGALVSTLVEINAIKKVTN